MIEIPDGVGFDRSLNQAQKGTPINFLRSADTATLPQTLSIRLVRVCNLNLPSKSFETATLTNLDHVALCRRCITGIKN